MIGLLAVAGIGAYHFLLAHKPLGAVVSGVIAILGCIPMEARRRELRSGDRAASEWQVLATAAACALLALGIVVSTR